MKGKKYKNIFTKEQCDSITNAMMELKRLNCLNVEDDITYYYNSLGINNLPEALNLLPVVDKIIRKDHPNITFQNTYTRIYHNQSTLRMHTDRPGLFLTLSICVYSDLDEKWPLCVSNLEHHGAWSFSPTNRSYMSDFTEYETPVRSGATCFGIIHPHWRETLNCKPDQKVIQTFYHWDTTEKMDLTVV